MERVLGSQELYNTNILRNITLQKWQQRSETSEKERITAKLILHSTEKNVKGIILQKDPISLYTHNHTINISKYTKNHISA